MFNQEIKEKYLATRTGRTAKDAETILDMFEEMEANFGIDIAEMSLDQLGACLESRHFVEPTALRNITDMLSSYANWYHDGDKHAHHIREYRLEDYPYAENLRPTLFHSAEELLYVLRQVYDFDSGQPAIPALCFAWLGIDSPSALKLKKEQVDTVAGRIYNDDGECIVETMPEIIREVLDIYSKTYRAERTQSQTFTVYADDQGLFIRRMITINSQKAGKPISTAQLATWIAELRRTYESEFGPCPALNYTNVQRSGNFYRLHELAKSGVDVRSLKNKELVRSILGKSKRYHKDNMIMYDAYLTCIGEK